MTSHVNDPLRNHNLSLVLKVHLNFPRFPGSVDILDLFTRLTDLTDLQISLLELIFLRQLPRLRHFFSQISLFQLLIFYRGMIQGWDLEFLQVYVTFTFLFSENEYG